MPASCPYCGATLNFGLKFCVVCGRHTSSSEMTKLGGGLKSGIKQADLTRRLDDNLSSADFDKSRRPNRLKRHIRNVSERVFYAFIFVALFFCAVRFTLQTFFPGRIHNVLVPILGKHTAIVEQTLTGHSEEDPKDPAAVDPDADKKPNDGSKKPSSMKKHRPHKHGRRSG